MEDDKLIYLLKKTTHTTQQQLVVRWLHRLLVGKQLPAELYIVLATRLRWVGFQ